MTKIHFIHFIDFELSTFYGHLTPILHLGKQNTKPFSHDLFPDSSFRGHIRDILLPLHEVND